MRFSDVIGQKEVCGHLAAQVDRNRVPHAQLLCGPEGCGKFAIAMAYASYLLCRQTGGGDSCGRCPSCRKMADFAHPDLHFIYPTIKKAACASLFAKWRGMALASPYFTLDDWSECMEVENQQPVIYEQESDALLRQLQLSASDGGRKVVIIWLPERMLEVTANKMLKTLEEPPAGAVLLLVSEEPARILATVLSRTQRVDVPPLRADDIRRTLAELNGLDGEDAARIARLAGGSYAEALKMTQAGDDARLFLDKFKALMRLAYARNVKELLEWSEQIASWGREKQKNFLGYALRMARENFVYNFRRPELNYMDSEESLFARRFSKFINERNITGIAAEMERARRDIAQNANARLVLFDFALKIIVLIRR